MNPQAKPGVPMDQPAQSVGAQPADTGPTQTVTVARGRTIRHDGRLYRAGEPLTLPEADLERFRALGFVATEQDAQSASDEEKARTQGPTFETKDGPNVKPKR